MRFIILIFCSLALLGCNNSFPNKNITGLTLPEMKGETLTKQQVSLPYMFESSPILLLVGYKQDSQFDIDRWLIALDMTKTDIKAIEVPAIQGMFPRMFSTMINNGMRDGIPKELWGGVITLYADGEKMQAFTGNEKGNNARILLIEQTGKILYFYDRGFSIQALKNLKNKK
ncbi:hypothetical protein CJF42_23780 [Pseudoalteromonas sp. NBT06-2]|uniref:hypothetical protein n=1 Tax=Pseudoalteromonas sp. NBT06-2 TaxID=2025950 RepID=UPI000BA7E214|nr:hypothetical protein [Pseudoalteromonas sp. NBT06-2]PAJ71974.1 hypothetical protein CJF42_23780 [Pseudoalteromonas sp. NBT06-2]